MSGRANEDFFFEVFKQLHFPYFSIDLYALARGLTAPNPSGTSHFGIRVPDVKARKASIIQAFRALFRGIDVPPVFDRHFAQSKIINDMFGCRHMLAKMTKQQNAAFAIAERADVLMWEEETAWPLAYSTFLTQLSTLFELYRQLVEHRLRELAEATGQPAEVLDQTSRVLPTRFHYAMASLGAWAGGAVNLQYFSYYATQPLTRDPVKNQEYAKLIGYSEADAKDLTDGGLIVVPASLACAIADAQGSIYLTGIGLNEFSGSNLPKKVLQLSDTVDASLAGFVIDKHYRAPFSAPPIEDDALYGNGNVLRDHYSEFYESVKFTELLRAKHYCIPIIDVRSMDEMREIVARVPPRGEERLYFRGQSSLYALQRPERIKRLLFGESCAIEPSLPTAATRNNVDYDSLHFALRYFVQEQILGQLSGRAEVAGIYELWLKEATSPKCELDYAIMALAQHYGIPTPGLDVTTDLHVATWFATNRFDKKDGRCSYEVSKPGAWNSSPEKWPIVFAGQTVTHSVGMSLQDCQELEKFGLAALRPQRQQALFFHGGHSDHQNRMAETLVCAFRLAPGLYPTACDFDQLFPPPEEDKAYKCLLEFGGEEPYASLGGKYVQRFH